MGRTESYLERAFDRGLDTFGIPEPDRQYQFHRWRFDFAWPYIRVAVEIDGGTFNGGHHVQGAGYQNDCRKNNQAQLEDWAVIRADRTMVFEDQLYKLVKKIIRKRLRYVKRKR